MVIMLASKHGLLGETLLSAEEKVLSQSEAIAGTLTVLPTNQSNIGNVHDMLA
jgi:hypothetical protein